MSKTLYNLKVPMVTVSEAYLKMLHKDSAELDVINRLELLSYSEWLTVIKTLEQESEVNT